jgi:hypothetical protein
MEGVGNLLSLRAACPAILTARCGVLRFLPDQFSKLGIHNAWVVLDNPLEHAYTLGLAISRRIKAPLNTSLLPMWRRFGFAMKTMEPFCNATNMKSGEQ